jgi:hypothetical protein
MQQDSRDIEKRYEDFITEVVKTETVWGLTHDDTWATSSSYEFEDTEVILFWSDKAGASACAEDDWAAYKPESITLVEFLENWCVGMYGDELLLGANWNPDLTGREVEPLAIAMEIITELKEQAKSLEFTQYDSQEEFEEQVIEALEGDGE